MVQLTYLMAFYISSNPFDEKIQSKNEEGTNRAKD